jgi:predicted TIM-barrel fold metal-dependent hydrolase
MNRRERVVDAHTHAFSPELLQNRELVAEQDYWFNALYANPAARAVDAPTLSAAAAAAGIAQSIVCGFPWSDPGRCRSENQWMADVAASDNSLAWLGIVVPGSSESAQDAAWCLEHGASGIGELNADGQGVSLLDPKLWQPLIEVARAYHRPLLLHASEAPGHHYAGKGTATPDKLVAWLAQAQDIDVIFAHWGGGLPFYELMPEVRRLTRRVFYDSAASTYLYDFAVFPRVIDLVGSDRILFGTDFPLLKQARFLTRTRDVLRNEDELSDVLSGNADRLFRLVGEGVAE